MRLVIHAGMHKTGSSSIQNTFRAIERPGFAYAPFADPNHSGAFKFMTYDAPEDIPKLRKPTLSDRQIARIRRDHRTLLRDFAGSSGGTGVFSAESMSIPGSEAHLERFRDIIGGTGAQVQVLMYVRAPGSHMESAFQQMVKTGGLPRLDMDRLWPRYRSRIESFDKVFGAENVVLRPFHPWDFPDGDVVRDFADFVGVEIGESEIVRANEGISAEAVALLFLYDRISRRETGRNASRDPAWVKRIGTIGSGKLRFSAGLLAPVMERHAADLDWVQNRMGLRLEDRRGSGSVEISGEDDLLELGYRQADALRQMLREDAGRFSALRDRELASLMDALKLLG